MPIEPKLLLAEFEEHFEEIFDECPEKCAELAARIGFAEQDRNEGHKHG